MARATSGSVARWAGYPAAFALPRMMYGDFTRGRPAGNPSPWTRRPARQDNERRDAGGQGRGLSCTQEDDAAQHDQGEEGGLSKQPGGSVRPGDDRQRGVAMTKKTDSPEDRLNDILGGTDEDGPPC